MRSLGSMLVLLASCLALAAADQYSEFDEMAGPANAHLVARKRVVESQVVAGQNITVSIEIFNTGAEAALDIHLEDHSFPASKFEKVAGDSTAAWDTIGANANITHKFTVKAKAPGTYGVGSAMITYTTAGGDEGEQMRMMSTPLGMLHVLSRQESYLALALTTGQYTSLGFLKSTSDWQKFLSLATVVVILLSVNSAVKQYKSYRRQNLYEKYYNELSADKSE